MQSSYWLPDFECNAVTRYTAFRPLCYLISRVARSLELAD
jgi:hypothetical protein